MKKWMVAGLCCCVVFCGGCAVPEAGSKQMVTTEASPVRVACCGDSNTAGYGANYVSLLQERLGSGYVVENFGENGATAMASGAHPYEATQGYEESRSFDADVVVLMFGTNDSNGDSWRGAAVFREEYEALVQAYLSGDSDCQLILCTPPAPDTSERPAEMVGFGVQPKVVADICAVIREVAQVQHLPLVDVYGLTIGQPSYVLDDGVHLSLDGAEVVAAAVAEAVSARA